MYLTDYHCHSILSPDGRAPLSAVARHALDAGLQEICLTDHCDLLSEDGKRVFCYDWAAALAQYRETVPQFAGKLTIRLGLEFGMGHLDPAVSADILAQPALDFVIGSIHNFSPEKGGIDFYFADYDAPPDCAAALDDYFTSMEQLAGTDYYDVLGHIIYPLRYMKGMATIDPYLDRVTEIMRTAVSRGKGIELNTYRGRTVEEWRPVLARYKAVGGEIVTMGSDAHDPACMGAGVPEACELLRETGFRFVAVYDKRRVKMMAL